MCNIYIFIIQRHLTHVLMHIYLLFVSIFCVHACKGVWVRRCVECVCRVRAFVTFRDRNVSRSLHAIQYMLRVLCRCMWSPPATYSAFFFLYSLMHKTIVHETLQIHRVYAV